MQQCIDRVRSVKCSIGLHRTGDHRESGKIGHEPSRTKQRSEPSAREIQFRGFRRAHLLPVHGRRTVLENVRTWKTEIIKANETQRLTRPSSVMACSSISF